LGTTWGTIWEPDGIPFGTWWEHSENTLGNQKKQKPSSSPHPKGARMHAGPSHWLPEIFIFRTLHLHFSLG